jgi:hypothetical protein
MITKIRQIIAYHVSLFLILISFGLLKPNYSGDPTVSATQFKNKSEISLDVNEVRNNKST